jgi:hypothetical protein
MLALAAMPRKSSIGFKFGQASRCRCDDHRHDRRIEAIAIDRHEAAGTGRYEIEYRPKTELMHLRRPDGL